MKQLIHDTEIEFGLRENAINVKTIWHRVHTGNVTGFTPQRTSPLAAMEPHIVQFCKVVAYMNCPLLCKEQVCSLAESLMKESEFALP